MGTFRLETNSPLEMHARSALQQARAARTPFNDKQYAAHLNYAYQKTESLQKAGATTEAMFSTVLDGERVWDPERAAQHADIITTFLNKWSTVPTDREAIVSGGLAGGGKTTTLTRHTHFNLDDYAFLSPDDVKHAMAERGMFPRIAGLTPMEVSALGYEEATYLTRALFTDCVERGRNLVFDTTLGSKAAAEEKIVPLREQGYRLSAVFVDIAPETSLRRSQERHRRGLNMFLRGTCAYGGRLLPRGAVQGQVLAGAAHSSKNRLVFDHYRESGWFAESYLFDNNTDGTHPQQVS